MELQGIYEAHLPVDDLAKARGFYGRALGLATGYVDEQRGSAFLFVEHGGDRWMLGLHEVEAGEPWGPADRHVAFRVGKPTLQSLIEELSTLGIEPLDNTGAPATEPVVHGWMPAAAVFFRDPSGNLLEALAELDEAPRPSLGTVPLSQWEASQETKLP